MILIILLRSMWWQRKIKWNWIETHPDLTWKNHIGYHRVTQYMYLKTCGIGISSLDVCFGEMLHTTLGSPWCLLEKMTQIIKLITQTNVYNVKNILHIHLPHSLSWVTRIVKTKLFNLSSSWYPRQSLSRQATTSHHEKNLQIEHASCLSTTRAQVLSIFTTFYEFSWYAWLTSF